MWATLNLLTLKAVDGEKYAAPGNDTSQTGEGQRNCPLETLAAMKAGMGRGRRREKCRLQQCLEDDMKNKTSEERKVCCKEATESCSQPQREQRQCPENGNQRVDTHGTAGPVMEVFTAPSLEQGKQ